MELNSRLNLSVLVATVMTLVIYLYDTLCLKPEKLRRALKRQGIKGPEPAFLFGNIHDVKRIVNEEETERGERNVEIAHDYSHTIFPYFDRWRKIYGPIYMFSAGSSVSLYVSDPELVKYVCFQGACFGSNYADGEEIFSKLSSLQLALPLQSTLARLPGSTYLPTKSNRLVWKLASEVRSLVQKVVKERKEKERERPTATVDELMTGLDESSNLKSSIKDGVDESFIVENCKNIYFAGQETTATAGKWVLLLLASNPQWQMHVREELTQVIQETLRLYPASPVSARQLYADMRFGDLRLPKGTSLWILNLQFHHDAKLWGPDANQFNPERFAKGVSVACKNPHMYMPFGFGPCTCMGQTFAMVELKIVLASILSRFNFSPSPKHQHSVELRLLLGPKYGVHLVIEKV